MLRLSVGPGCMIWPESRGTGKSCPKTVPGRGCSARPSETFHQLFIFVTSACHCGVVSTPQGDASMKKYLFGLTIIFALTVGVPVALAQNNQGQQDGVPRLDHVFVIVLENHNSFTSFGSNGIIGNPQAPNITALWNKYNVATDYNGVWHPSLPNYVAMITGDWIGTDVLGKTDSPPPNGTGNSYPAGSVVGISDDDSPSVALDFAHANPSHHRWRVDLPSLAGQLTNTGRDWRAYLQNIPESGTYFANWPGDSNTAKLYAVKHNPFPYVAEVQDNAFQFAKQVSFDRLFSDLGANRSPA